MQQSVNSDWSNDDQKAHLEVGGWVPLLSVDEAREKERIPDEEDGSVVSHEIPVAFLGVKLDGKAPGVTYRVC